MNAADEWREKGNAAFKAGRYRQAILFYTNAIELDSNNAMLFSNRSRAYLKLEQYEHSKLDARVCIDVDPKWSRGWWRLAAAHMEEKDFIGAKHIHEEALRYCPGDQSLIEAMKKNARLKREHELAEAERRAVAAQEQQKSNAACKCGGENVC